MWVHLKRLKLIGEFFFFKDGGCKWAKISNTLGCYRKGITSLPGDTIQECNSPCPRYLRLITH